MQRVLASPLFIALFAGLLAAAAAGFVAWQQLGFSRSQLPETVMQPQVEIGGPFSLTDHTGARVTDASYAGKHLLVYFGFTYCPDVCPTDLAVVGQAMDLLDEEAPEVSAQVQPLFISVDPGRDVPEQLAAYVENFHPRMVGLTGTEAEIADVASAYRAYYARRDLEDGEYLMDHSAFTYLVSPDGSAIGIFRHNSVPEDVAAGIKTLIEG